MNQYLKARHHFDGLSYSKKKAFVQGIEGWLLPAQTGASDSYTVDFTVSSGNQTGTGIGGGDVVYPDRAGHPGYRNVFDHE
jgi:hypothetical protein